MADLPSRKDLFDIGKSVIVQRATRIDPAQINTDGSDVNIMVASEAAMGEEVMRQLALGLKRLTLDGAADDPDEQYLDRYAWDRYQMRRKGAAAALATLRLSRVSAAAGAGVQSEGFLVRTQTGIQYRALASVTWGAADVGPHDVDAQAVEAGKETQVGAGTLESFVVQPFDPSITVTNPDPAAGGEPRESNATFANRVRDAYLNARRGVASAIEQGALAVLGVVSAKAVEAVDDTTAPQRFVELFIADSDGLASTALARKVVLSLLEYRCCGIYVRVNTSTPQFESVSLRLRFRTGVDTLALTGQVRAAVVAFVNSLGAGDDLYVNDLEAVLNRFTPFGLVVERDAVVAPVGDVVAESSQTIRTTLDRVTVE